MTRSIFSGLFGLISVVAVGSLPTACQSGGVGDPCIPEDEYTPQFAGFKVTEENIESRSFQCQTRICLVNHFQGRVSCPLGQEAPTPCGGPDDTTTCGDKGTCVPAAPLTADCKDNNECVAFGGTCNQNTGSCECNASTCPEGTFCNAATRLCTAYVCHREGECQVADAKESDNQGKNCCVPGTDTPITSPVCGQCGGNSNRNAERAVYCSCRCGVAEGEPEDENFNFCDCPTGFECQEIRKNVGLGDEQITGKYCIKQGSLFESELDCQTVPGYFSPDQCKGTKAPSAGGGS